MKYAAKVTLKQTQQKALLGAHRTMSANLQAQLAANPDPARILELVEIQNQIAQLQHDLTKDILIKLNKEEKVEYNT